MFVNSLLIVLLLQDNLPLKPTNQFEINTNYQLKKKLISENDKIVFDKKEVKKETGTDLLPYLQIKLKIKRWHPDVDLVKVVDDGNKTVLRKKVNDDGLYDLDLGYVDDIKDGVTSGKFTVQFLERKKIIEVITISVEKDGTFLVNGEKRGKF